MPKAGLVLVLASGMTVLAARAGASCLVKNETGWEFVISSGNAANQKLGAHAATTIEAGEIAGKSPEGVPLLSPAKQAR
jgi:hypothetical protein